MSSQSAAMVLVIFSILSFGQRSHADTPVTQPSAIEAKLNDRLPDLTLEGRTLPQVLMAIADQTHLNLVGEWKQLQNNGADRTATLHGRLMNVTVREAIQLAVAEAGGSKPAVLDVQGQIVHIASPDVLETRVYSLDRVLAKLQKTQSDRQAAIDSVIKLIQDSIVPDTWRNAGGQIGSISTFGNKLVITHLREQQIQIAALLADLEK